MFIYLITNLVNGKSYVGKTTQTIEERWHQHLQNAKSKVPYHLYRALRKYGTDAFSVQTLATTEDPEELNNLERVWILTLGTHSTQYGYNMTYGGDGVAATDEVRQKISESMKGRTLSDSHKVAIGLRHRGKVTSLSTRQKMASHWNHERKQEQAGIARRVNEVENKKLKDYTCPDCGKEFEQVTKGVYGGHRKACLHWKEMAQMVEEEMGKTLDEILGE
jgi:group I intron endonuclease